MYKLSNTWITDPRIDSEYKYYCLKAYERSLLLALERWELEPAYSDAGEKLRSAKDLLSKFNRLKNEFPTKIKGASPDSPRWETELTVNDSETEREILSTLGFAVPSLENTIQQITLRIEEGKQKISCEPLGLIPHFKEEGLLFILDKWNNRLIAYLYRLRTLMPQFKLSLSHITSISRTAGLNLNALKNSIASNADLSFPATFLCMCEDPIPLNSGLLPLARRHILQAIRS